MEMCRLLGPGWEGGGFCGRRGQRCGHRGGDRRLLCTLRDALPVWGVGKGGLRVDCEIVLYASRAPPLLAHVSQGGEDPTGLTELPLYRRFNSCPPHLRTDDLPAALVTMHRGMHDRHTRKQDLGGPPLTQYKPLRFQTFKPWILDPPTATSAGEFRLGCFVVPIPRRTTDGTRFQYHDTQVHALLRAL